MRVTMPMLFDILKKRFPVEKGKGYDSGITLLMVCGTNIGQLQKRDCVLLLDGDAPVAGVLSADEARIVRVWRPGSSRPENCALVVLTNKPVIDVIEAAEEGLSRYRNWFNRMADLVLDGGADVQKLVDFSHEILGNPITVQDRAMRVKACTAYDAMDDEMWTPLDSRLEPFSNPGIPDGFEAFLKDIERRREITDYVMFNGVRLFACKTREVSGDYLIVSLLEKNRSITEGDVDVVRALCSCIELSMKTSERQFKEVIGYNGLLIDALEGRITNPVELKNRMNALGYPLKPIVRVMVAVPQKGKLNDRQASRFINDILNTFPFGRGILYEGRLVFLATYDSAGQVTAADLSRFELYLEKYRMVAAMSELRPIDYSIRTLYEAAVFNIDVGRHARPERYLYYFEECQPYWVFETCLQRGDSDFYVHPALEALREYDMREQTSLYEVLRLLVLNRGNRSQTAKSLYMQRNTLQSRIKEIELICKIDLSSPAEIDYIRRSFMLEDYVKAGYCLGYQGGA